MKVAITGATGFIGQHVIKAIEQYDVEVIAVVRDLAKVPKDWKCTIKQFDITQIKSDIFTTLGSPDVLIHLAWGGLPKYNSMHHIENELPAQYNFLSQLIKEGLKSLVVAGTCLEYGMQYGPLHESMQVQPTTPYGYAKNALRTQLEYLKMERDFNFSWGRLFYLYGIGQPSKTIYSQLHMAVEEGKEFFNMSGGEQLRDYLSVKTVAFLLSFLAIKKADIGVINIASGNPVSIRSLVERWIQENEWKIKPNLGFYPYPQYEPMAFWGDTTKLNAFKNNS